MKSKSIQLIVILILCSLIISPVAAQTGPAGLRGEGLEFEAVTDVVAVGNPNAKVIGEEKGATEPAVYIVQLTDASLATYRGGVDGLAATSPAATGAVRLDVNSAASRAYLGYLAEARAKVLGEAQKILGREVATRFVFDVVFNGFAVVLDPAEAADMAKMPGVKMVKRETMYQLMTDVSPEFLGADHLWDGSATPSGVGAQGEGVIIGVLDTGINFDSPSFFEVGPVDGYEHVNPNGAGVFLGWCDSNNPNYDASYACNDKLIGAWDFADAYGESDGPWDDHSHGSHTASTSGGNLVNTSIEAPTTSYDTSLSGIARHANIIAYDVCVAGCPEGASIAATQQAVIDGVDVINFSIGGGSSDPWADAGAMAFLDAVEAGVVVVTSAGNSGPDAGTMGSPGDAPWMFTVGNSTHNRMIENWLTDMSGGDTTAPANIRGVGLTAGYGPALIVYAGDYPNANDPTGDPAQCLQPYPANTFSGEIVVCDRGAIARVDKGANVLAGGAGGFVLANTDSSGESIVADPHYLPGVHIGDNDGDVLRAWLASGSGHMATISGFIVDTSGYNADNMASSSSRGPSNSLPSVIKPDVAAPGTDILAAYNTGTDYGLMSGTSMASPHVAGAAALLRAVHPDWTVAEVKSALMMTANSTMDKEDGATPADPFDMGAGRIDLNVAALAGLVMDETKAKFEAADPKLAGDPTSLNIASLDNPSCLSECSWTRVFREVVAGYVAEYTISFEGDIPMTATPNSFITKGNNTDTHSVTFTADVSGLNSGEWYFGTVVLTPAVQAPNGLAEPNLPTLHLPVAVVPTSGVLPDLVEFETRRNAGSIMLEDLEAIEITDLKVESFGLVQADLDSFELIQDPTNGSPFDTAEGVFVKQVVVGANAKRLVAEVTASEAPDADLFVIFGPDILCQSTTSSWDEYCDLTDPAAGTYYVLVQNWQGTANQPDAMTLATAVVTGDETNFTVSGPSSVPALTPFDLQLRWDTPTMQEGDRWYGAFSLGTDTGKPGNIATIPVNIQRIADDVTKSANVEVALPGDIVTYTISVQPNVMPEDLAYMITDTIPAGTTYVIDSLTASKGTAQHANGEITWSLDMPVPMYDYNITTSANDPWCDTGFGGYVDLAGFGIKPQAAIAGDSSAWTVNGWSVNLYGADYPVSLTDDGFIVFDVANNWVGSTPWFPQSIPDVTKPNNLVAALWQDMEIFYDLDTNTGVSLATAGGGTVKIIEYDDIEYWGGSEESWDFVIVSWPLDDAPGAYEFIVAYDNLSEVSGPLTIGIENADGTQGQALVNNGDATGVISNGFMACFDYVQVGANVETLTYAVKVDAEVPLGSVLTNEVLHQTGNPWSVEALTWDDVYIGNRLFWYPLMP